MQEQECPMCGDSFAGGVQGAPVDSFRERFCCEECRDQAERWENQRRASGGGSNLRSRAPWKAPESFPWDSSDPFAE
jgi:hypothetical protein